MNITHEFVSFAPPVPKHTVITDGGRIAAGFTQERLDCAVRAVALARGISYNVAHAMLAAAGRRDRHKFAFCDYMSTQLWADHFIGGGTVRAFIAAHNDGTYIVRISGHVFAVCGGMALDTFDVGRRSFRIVEYWKIKGGENV